MRLSYRKAIEELAAIQHCCPACYKTDSLVSRHREIPAEDEFGLPQFDSDSNPVRESHDSYKCTNCGQHFTVGVSLRYEVRVEYKEHVGDTLRPDASLDQML